MFKMTEVHLLFSGYYVISLAEVGEKLLGGFMWKPVQKSWSRKRFSLTEEGALSGSGSAFHLVMYARDLHGQAEEGPRLSQRWRVAPYRSRVKHAPGSAAARVPGQGRRPDGSTAVSVCMSAC